MNTIARKVVGALLAAFAMSIGTTLSELARDAIKERFAPKPEAKTRRKGKR